MSTSCYTSGMILEMEEYLVVRGEVRFLWRILACHRKKSAGKNGVFFAFLIFTFYVRYCTSKLKASLVIICISYDA